MQTIADQTGIGRTSVRKVLLAEGRVDGDQTLAWQFGGVEPLPGRWLCFEGGGPLATPAA